jgi:hypothetical protein
MFFGRWHRRPRTERGWWAVAVRLLALVLALSVSAPAGMARDLDYHGRGHHPDVAVATVGAPADTDTADPGLDCHLHCGCHQLAAVAIGPVLLALDTARPVYARVTKKVSSLALDGLLRPPRT